MVVVRIDFRRRFLSLLSYKFRDFGSVMALSVLEAVNNGLKGYESGENGDGGTFFPFFLCHFEMKADGRNRFIIH